jgi:excisionase family DNA binding protein
MSLQPLLTVKEVARRLAVSESKAYDLVARGEIPCVELGRNVRVSEADLERFVRENSTRRSYSYEQGDDGKARR